ncbi:unnamed protein product [Chironomus riparius]|uniref:Uncharacterized protein n=1 Tax=Chironomus riparius TaxID=315576 RepID=A0A9N9RID3_9DIPT|nr:unnamed protein product [Chironomus riparius]
MRIYSHRTIKSLMGRPRFAQHKFEGPKLKMYFLLGSLLKKIFFIQSLI